jgi:hypothetical protein
MRGEDDAGACAFRSFHFIDAKAGRQTMEMRNVWTLAVEIASEEIRTAYFDPRLSFITSCVRGDRIPEDLDPIVTIFAGAAETGQRRRDRHVVSKISQPRREAGDEYLGASDALWKIPADEMNYSHFRRIDLTMTFGSHRLSRRLP